MNILYFLVALTNSVDMASSQNYCNAAHSCYNTNWPAVSLVECGGAYSCEDSGHFGVTESCVGLHSCLNSDIGAVSIYCNGGGSCTGGDSLLMKDLYCGGDRSCSSIWSISSRQEASNINGATVIGEGYLSLADSTIFNAVTIDCSGTRSCENLSVFIDEGYPGCVIYCRGYSCNGLQHTTYGGPILMLNSYSGFYDELRISYSFLDLINMYPDPSEYKGSDDGNSDNICNSNIYSKTIECNDYSECSNSVQTQINSYPICCNGKFSCSESTLEHNGHFVSGDDPNAQFIRCDGVYACVSSNIYNNVDGGDIYISGYESAAYSYVYSNNGNIIIESRLGCYSSEIVNANNIYVTGGWGLSNSNVDVVNNRVYYLADYSGTNVIHNTIGGILYCLASRACKGLTVNTFVSIVVCDAALSCENGVFNGIQNGLFASSGDSLNSARITTTTSQHSSDFGEFILYVGDDINTNYYLTCKSNIICHIICDSPNACKHLEITREAQSTQILVDCDETGDIIACPQIVNDFTPNPTPIPTTASPTRLTTASPTPSPTPSPTCLVRMYTGFSGDFNGAEGSWGPYGIGNYSCCNKTNSNNNELNVKYSSFDKNAVNAIIVDAEINNNNMHCFVRLYAESTSKGEDWKEYKIDSGDIKLINYSTPVYREEFVNDIVWDKSSSQVSWMNVRSQGNTKKKLVSNKENKNKQSGSNMDCCCCCCLQIIEARCEVQMYHGFYGDGFEEYRTYDVGSYSCCDDFDGLNDDTLYNSFTNDRINSIVVNSKYGYDCKVRLYAAIISNEYDGHDWREYIVNRGDIKTINWQTVPSDSNELQNTPYTVWDQTYSQVSWMVIESM